MKLDRSLETRALQPTGWPPYDVSARAVSRVPAPVRNVPFCEASRRPTHWPPRPNLTAQFQRRFVTKLRLKRPSDAPASRYGEPSLPGFRRCLGAIVIVAAVAAGCRGPSTSSGQDPLTSSGTGGSTSSGQRASGEIARGGSLAGSVRAEPRSFNAWVISGQTEETVAFLTAAKLVRINRLTDEVEPWLAESWEDVSGQWAVGSQARSLKPVA